MRMLAVQLPLGTKLICAGESDLGVQTPKLKRICTSAAAFAAILTPALGRTEQVSLKVTRESIKFEKLSKSFLAGLEKLHPIFATVLGVHRYDALIGDFSTGRRAAEIPFLTSMAKRLREIQISHLSADQKVDAAMLDNEIEYRLWISRVLKVWQQGLQVDNAVISSGLYSIAARPFASWHEWMRSATSRMEKISAMYRQMQADIDSARFSKASASIYLLRSLLLDGALANNRPVSH